MPALRRTVSLLVIATLPLRAVIAQQGFFVTAGRVLAGTPEESSWHLTLQRDVIGPVGVDGSVMVLPGGRPAEGELYGVGADLTLFSGAHGIPTIFVGTSAGLGFVSQERFWASGSF